MFWNKKGSEMSMNIIIIAAIALLVLAILAVLLMKQGGNLAESTSCEGMGGYCEDSMSACEGTDVPKPDSGCKTKLGSDKGYCCIPLG